MVVPAGSYTVVMDSFDDHTTKLDQTSQTEEQWYFVLDGGYVSPTSGDLDDDQDVRRDVFTDQDIAASTSITLMHRGEGNVNSVQPTCVGFTRNADPEPAVAEPEEAAAAMEPGADPDPQVVESDFATTEISNEQVGNLVSNEEIVQEPQAAGEPDGPTPEDPPAASVVESDVAADEGEPEAEIQQVASSTEIVREPVDRSNASAPAPQLALTGPSTGLGVGVIGLGLLLLGALMRLAAASVSRLRGA